MEAKIYIASKAIHGPRWRELRDSGVPFSSTWIDEAEPGKTSDWSVLYYRCLKEASEADALICYSEPGEILTGALVEVGAALARHVRVLWVGPEDKVCHHPLVTVFTTLEEAIEKAKQLALSRRQLQLAHLFGGSC